MSTISNTIENTVRSAGYSHYLGTNEVQAAIRQIENDLASGGRSVEEVVSAALRANGLGSYTSYTGPVVEALEAHFAEGGEQGEVEEVEGFEGFDREHAADVIREAARTHGLLERVVEEVLVEAGLVDPEPEPEPEPEVEQDSDEQVGDIARRIEQTVGQIVERLNAMEQFARQHGFRG